MTTSLTNSAFHISATLIPEFPFNEREGCTLFGNLLDNAIEACEKITGRKKCINVRIEKQKKLLFLEISNSSTDEMVYKNGELVTTKKQKFQHGYGLKSVKRIVEKYGGIISYHVKDKMFFVHITFFDVNNNILRRRD